MPPVLAALRIEVTAPDGSVWRVRQFLGLDLTQTMRQYADTFTLRLGDPGSTLHTKVDNDSKIAIYLGDDLLLSGSIDTVTWSSANQQKTVAVQGRSTAAEFAEDHAEPKKYKQTTDNAVIQEMLAGQGLAFELDAARTYKQFDVAVGRSKADVAHSIAKQGGYYLWQSGTTIYKKKPASSGAATRTYRTLDLPGDGTAILEIGDLVKSTKHCRTKVVGFASDSKHAKVIETRTVVPSLKLQNPERPLNVSRTFRVALPAKEKDEAIRMMDDSVYKAQPYESLSLTVRGMDNIPINGVATVRIPTRSIDSDLVCYEKAYRVDEQGRATSTLSFVPLGRPLPE